MIFHLMFFIYSRVLYLSHCLSSPQKDELDDIPIELSKVQSVKVGRYIVVIPPNLLPKSFNFHVFASLAVYLLSRLFKKLFIGYIVVNLNFI